MKTKVAGGILVIVLVLLAAWLVWHALTPRGVRPAATKLQKKWQFTTAGRVSGALALGADGTLYAASEDGFLYAVDAAGNLQWKFNAGPMEAAPAVGTDGTIYVTNGEEKIFAINHNGTQQWAVGGGPFADKNMGHIAAALDENYLYTPWRGGLRALRLTTGLSDWTAGLGFKRSGAVSILPNGVIAFTEVGRLKAVFNEGRTVWEYPVMDPPLTTDMILKGHIPEGNFWLESGIAVGADGNVYACGTDSRLVALTWSGAYKWEFKTKTRTINRASPLIAGDGTIYFASEDGILHALTPIGTQKWEINTGGAIAATPLLTEDGTIYLANSAGVMAVSPEGNVLEKMPTEGPGESSPTLAPDGTIYVVIGTGKIAAITGTHGGLMASPWPKFQGDIANNGRAH